MSVYENDSLADTEKSAFNSWMSVAIVHQKFSQTLLFTICTLNFKMTNPKQKMCKGRGNFSTKFFLFFFCFCRELRKWAQLTWHLAKISMKLIKINWKRFWKQCHCHCHKAFSWSIDRQNIAVKAENNKLRKTFPRA